MAKKTEEQKEERAEEKTGAKVLGVYLKGKLVREYPASEYVIYPDRKVLAAEEYAKKICGTVEKIR